MKADFQPHTAVYQGDHVFNKRTPDQEYTPDLHYHDFYEVQLYLEGSCNLIVGENEYELGRGDIALLNMFEQHQLVKTKSKDYSRYCISVDASLLLSMCSEDVNVRNIFYSDNRYYPIRHLEEREFLPYIEILKRYEAIPQRRGKELWERSVLFELFGNLYSDCYDETISRSADTNYLSMISKLVKYVNEHLNENLSLGTLSSVSNFSVYHMCRIFKKYTGRTLNQYIQSKRIEKAKMLLKEEMPIGDVAAQVGFHNYSCFYKAFFRECGVNPAAYRLSNETVWL